MAAENKHKVLHYRHAQFLQGANNLQHMLSAALAKLKHVGKRQEPLDPGNSELRLINHHRRELGMKFGNMLTYVRGTNKLLLTLDTDVEALDVGQLAPPPSRSGKRTEFLDSILYYGVMNNHVVLLQSMALRSRDYETHLNWLLQQAGVMDPEDRVELVDMPKPEVRRRAEAAPVKSIQLAAPIFEVGAEVHAPRKRSERKLVVKDGIGASMLRAILGDNDFDKLQLDEAAFDGNLRVNLEITYSRTTSDSGQHALNSIARAFRHVDTVDSEDLTFQIPGIGRVKGNELKISDTVIVRANSGAVDQNDLFPQMHKWLHGLIERRLVEHE